MSTVKISFLICLFLIVCCMLQAQVQHNYDENKVPDFVLPPLLQDTAGHVITTTKGWEDSRRGQILRNYERYVYGKVPANELQMTFQPVDLQVNAFNNKAIKKEIKVVFTDSKNAVDMNILIFLPKVVRGPSPVFLGLNFYGNHTIHDDQGIAIHKKWVRNNEEFGIIDNTATEKSRGVRSHRWPVEDILQRGYGLATIYYGDLYPDHAAGAGGGVHGLFKSKGLADSSSWGAIATWAWGLSRAMDYFEKDPDIDATRVIVMGHSRLGKAALWAGAVDTRFAAVISNNSGCGGAALFRRRYGETIGVINNHFPHWFCQNFHLFNHREDNLPVDQHMLIAMMAPRPVYVASAVEDRWADPKGEFLSAYYATEVYRLYGLGGIEEKTMPPVNKPILSSKVGYHIRSGVHDVTDFDWEKFMDFADLHLR